MNPTQPAKLFWLILLAAFWAFYGLTGRDAWKADEALALAPVLDALTDPARAWHASAPLHVWAASVAAKLGAPWLTPQDGARLASGVFTLASLLFTGLAARRLFGPGFGSTAVLALVGCLGLMLRMHALAPETAMLAAWSALLAGVAYGRDSTRLGGALIGLSLSALFLGLRGWPDLAAGLALLLLPLLSPEWRRPTYRRALVLGLGVASVLCAAALLYLHAVGHLADWLRWHGFQRLASGTPSFRVFSELTWLSWPIWPLALAALWHEHRRLGRARELHLPLLALLAALLSTLGPSWSRDGGLLPMLPPLALLAAYGVDSMKRGAAQAFYWFGVVCFVFFIFAFWTYFVALEWGMPTRLAAHVARLTPSYQPGSLPGTSLLFAVAASALWLLAIPLFPRAKIRPVLVWASGMVLVWTLLIALYRPWMEAGWGYQPLIADLNRHLPAGACLKIDTDPAMRTMLRYHLHPKRNADCPWLLVSADRKVATDSAPVWEGARPRQKQQRYRLYYITR
jgi:4-amino-4-deoxy-L-arabinose transferase-like glycosyltransferase